MPPTHNIQVLILVLLVTGFLFLESCYSTRFLFRKQSGYRIFLWAVAAGTALLLTSRLLLVTLSTYLANQPHSKTFGLLESGRQILHRYFDFPFAGTTLVAIMLSLILATIWNRSSPKDRALLKIAKKTEPFLYLLLAAARPPTQPVLLTLKNRKCYVGYFVELSHLAPELTHCTLLPTMSGYRTEGELHLELTTVYGESIELVDNLENALLIDSEAVTQRIMELQIVIDRQEILSASIFNEDLFYDLYQQRPVGEPMVEPPPAVHLHTDSSSRTQDFIFGVGLGLLYARLLGKRH